MALAFTSLDTGSESSSDGTVLTASESPTDGAVLYLSVVTTSATGVGYSAHTVAASGLSGTWDVLGAITYSSRRTLHLIRGTKGSAWGSGQITITVTGGGSALQDVAYTLDQVTGANAADPDDALVSATNQDSLALADVGTPDAGDAVFVTGAHEDGANNFACTGYTGISTIGGLGNVRQIRSFYDDSSPDETPNMTSDGGGNAIGAIALIVNVDPGGGGAAALSIVPIIQNYRNMRIM